MQVTVNGEIKQITCNNKMPMYAEDGTDYPGCSSTIKVCKQCILEHLGIKENKGWDDETNIKYDTYINIGSDSISI